nr:putative zinc finger, CCHC-type [Tanacetum cinerariifolium]
MMNMVPREAFACSCAEGDVVLRQSYKPESCGMGSPWEHTAHAREEFLKMKCCLFQKKDSEKHHDRMSQRFYCLNGVDDVNLKQVFLNSFPESLGNEAYQALQARNVTIAQTTIGKLYQLILNTLTKLCNQKKFLAEFERTGKRLGTTCDDKYLQIKRKDNKKWKVIRKKNQRGRTSERCFIYQKRGHFVRNYTDKKRSQALIQALNQVEPVDVSNLESLYSLDDEPSDSVLCTITYSDFSSNDNSDTDSLETDDQFPLSQKKFLFQHLADARVLSKFDLKSGFWQLETSDDDDDARSLWSSDDDEHFDPFEDDLTHPDAR